jgi:tetratricopeptide (TPR) repeat protein
LDDVRGYLDRHAFAELDARFKADLDRHFSKDDFSEIIHRDFDRFDGSVASGQLSMRWLEKAPGSPYALTARGEYFLAMAYKARGGKWAADTPAENMQRMSEFVDKAIESYRQALALEPRLQQADAGIVSAASRESRYSELEAAFEHGMGVDPACKVLTGAMMVTLEPRWGGSYAAMTALAVQLSAYVRQRPLLALNTIWPQVDAAEMASRNDGYDAGVRLLRSVLTDSANATVFDDMGTWLDHATSVDRWEQLVILLEASRFNTGTQEANRIRGRLLVNLAKEPKWAIDSLKTAIELDPEDAYAHYLLGAAYWNSGSPAESETDYLAAMKDADTRRDALHELTRAMLGAHQFAKARKYVDLLNKEYPKFAPGWMTRGSVLLSQGINGEEVIRALRKFAATADPNNFEEMQDLQRVRKMLKVIDNPSATATK